MIPLDTILVLAITAIAIILFLSEKMRVDVAALCVLVLLLLFKIIRPEQAMYGFANTATATVAGMFVMSAGLVRTGFVEWMARYLDRVAGEGEVRLIIVLTMAVALLSAFLVNTATVAILIPVAVILAKSRDISPSRILIPLSFAGQFGGVCTLIGTSTNILVNSAAVTGGLAPFGFFEFTPLGIILVFIGICYLSLCSRILIPKRQGIDEQIDKYRLSDYLAEMKVTGGSPLAGKRWREIENRDLQEVDLIKIIREGKATWRASATKIRQDDILLVHGSANDLLRMIHNYRLETKADTVIDDRNLTSDRIELIEALVPPRSRLVGSTLRKADYIRRFGCVALAMQRRGKILRERLADIIFDDGDTLLLQCDRQSVRRIMESADLVVTNELTELHLRKDKALEALAIFSVVIALVVFNIVTLLTATLTGAVAMVLGRCISIEEAYKAIDWKVIFLLGGIFPLGLALEQTGTASWIVGMIMKPLMEMGPMAALTIVYLITALFSALMSNNASAILLAPIAFSAAELLDVSAKPFLMAVAFAASASFATPVGYQTNAMVYAPGGYRFSDYVRIGVPLNILFWAVTVWLAPVLWPF
ncbi:MAG: SLC13 family permease [Syntrophales bacterium]|jgi:di/tricarboxylate transporter|nr:SLC13 family permease [Syntrophales bacterium]MDY0043448.1 SLC13 family permease [Syntrophales bacterium]